MTATPTTSPAHQVGDRVQVRHNGKPTPGRISSIHHKNNRVQYVVRTDPVDDGTGARGGLGEVLNIWTTCGQSSFLRRDTVSDELR